MGGAGAWSCDLPTPSVALAIGAHPDDVEFGAGGTLAKWAADGCIVHHLICTDGSKGTWDVDADLPALVERRRHEQREAARRLSGECAGDVRFLSAVDGELDPTVEHRIEIVRAIRDLRPDVVLGHDPWKRYRLHPDHRAAGLLTCDAVVAARDPHFFPGVGPAHHRPSHLFLFEADEPDHVEDVAASVDRKLAALHAHESQFESTMHAADDAELAAFDERVTARLAELGAPHGVRLAEVFKRISDL
ncbi:MAG: PIG-L domain-containing protein [Acidimicrobiaceae bacterium]|nr:PIG-L domain-containing protein [Acidimicrobiaceae bacterium]